MSLQREIYQFSTSLILFGIEQEIVINTLGANFGGMSL